MIITRFQECGWCGYIYPITTSEICPYCGYKKVHTASSQIVFEETHSHKTASRYPDYYDFSGNYYDEYYTQCG